MPTSSIMTTDPGAEGREAAEEVTTMTLYKVLGSDAQSIHQGTATWYKPHGQRPGKWMPAVGNVRCCFRGYHLVELSALPQWLRAGCTIYLAEGKGPKDSDGSGKTAFAQARLVRQLHISERDLRLFAADCAEHVLPIFKKERPDDDRPRKAIKVARAFARGEVDAAARDAAWDAAGAAAGDAAGAAAWAAARAAARDAAEAAAGDAAWAAAGAAARAAARAAAWAAAGDAAWAAAAAAAGAAAWAAARAAARAAAWAAAEAAERQWQSECLLTYLEAKPEAKPDTPPTLESDSRP